MKLIFISHPYADDPVGNRQRVDRICRKLNRNDAILPISPLHLFSFAEDDQKRSSILEVCHRLIDMCDEVWCYGDSRGCRREVAYARTIGKPVRFVARHTARSRTVRYDGTADETDA